MIYIVDNMHASPYKEEIIGTEHERVSNESKEFDFLVELDDNQSNVKNEYNRQS